MECVWIEHHSNELPIINEHPFIRSRAVISSEHKMKILELFKSSSRKYLRYSDQKKKSHIEIQRDRKVVLHIIAMVFRTIWNFQQIPLSSMPKLLGTLDNAFLKLNIALGQLESVAILMLYLWTNNIPVLSIYSKMFCLTANLLRCAVDLAAFFMRRFKPIRKHNVVELYNFSTTRKTHIWQIDSENGSCHQ